MITNKKIVLTGATSGIGLEVLKLLCQGDNTILAVGRHVERLEGLDEKKVIPFKCDVASKEGVDTIFEAAIEKLGGIDIFYCNAGYAEYEEFNYVDWDRVQDMFNTNVFSVMYSYQKYYAYLNGKDGQFAATLSAMSKMAMPGYAIYAGTKFALEGFQQALRLERHTNLPVTCLYPIATDTRFFKEDGKRNYKRPFPVQTPQLVAKKMVRGIEKKKKSVNPSGLFGFARVLMTILPFVRTIYWNMEYKKFKAFTDAKHEDASKAAK